MPVLNTVFQRALDQNKIRNKEIARMNIEFVISNIQEDWLFANLEESSNFLPMNSQNPPSSLLSFRSFDGRILRFYKEGEELMKDFNFIGKNAITPKIVSHFSVQRLDLQNHYSIQIRIKDKYGNSIFKILTTEKN